MGATAAAAPAGFSDWVRNPHTQVRLVALGPVEGTSTREAAVEIRLDPGYLTYWRQPGEAGLPPTFDTTASRNVASMTAAYPAPHLFEEAGVPLFGYRGTVVFPLRLVPADPAAPTRLVLGLDYAICAAICLPGRADLSLDLPDATSPAAAALVEAARAAVPRPAALGAPGSIAIAGVAPDPAAAKPTLLVTARAAAPADLFVEGPEGWFFLAGAPVAGAPGTLVFPVVITDRPAGSATAVDLRLTLVEPSGAIEVPARVDVGAPKP